MKKLEKDITLPVSGYQARIQEGDGHAERILYSSTDGVALIEALPDYWAYLTVELNGNKPDRGNILALTVPDQHYLAIEIWKLSYGDDLELSGNCPNCGAGLDAVVDLSKLELIPLPKDAEQPNPTWEIKLPRTGKKAVIGYVTGEQEMEDVHNEDFDPNRLSFKIVKTLSGKEASYEEIANLPLQDHKVIRKAAKSKSCGYDTDINYRCNKCKKTSTINLLADPGFLFVGVVD